MIAQSCSRPQLRSKTSPTPNAIRCSSEHWSSCAKDSKSSGAELASETVWIEGCPRWSGNGWLPQTALVQKRTNNKALSNEAFVRQVIMRTEPGT